MQIQSEQCMYISPCFCSNLDGDVYLFSPQSVIYLRKLTGALIDLSFSFYSYVIMYKYMN